MSDAPASPAPISPGPSRIRNAARVLIVSSVMFSFISYWRTAAVVLCDLASTAYYIGGIVEQAIGPAAPWFILAVMLFSYAVRSVYIESSALFVRGGVYRVVKEALGGFLAKLSVSALMFDYILTGPISAVSAGQYIVGLLIASYSTVTHTHIDKEVIDLWKSGGSVLIACLITLYFFRQNLLGIHESSDKALKIMIATTIMAVVIAAWCGLTLIMDGPRNSVPIEPDLAPQVDPNTGERVSPLGFLEGTGLGRSLENLHGRDWLSLIGLIGLFIAFGHSILAMSGEETLAQVYREVESPKLPNFKKAAFIVFIYSLVLTGGISFMAVLLIPNDVRMKVYADNLIGGLAMHVVGPVEARLFLNAFVVVVGFMILAGAVNTAIIGSNGVLNRVSEDGVMPDWFLKPHHRYGTTHRILYLILGLQLFTILVSRGDVIALGEAYAFGVVWSFVFKALAMLVLRFRQSEHREYKVPLNIRIGKLEVPIGLGLIFIILLIAAILNLLTKTTATRWGLGFTAAFLTVFLGSEYYHERRRRKSGKHEHLEQFNRQQVGDASVESLGLTKSFRKLVAIRSPRNLYTLEKVLRETDPETTSIVVMTAKVAPRGAELQGAPSDFDQYDQQLMTAVVQYAERAGKEVKPLIVPTNNPLYAIMKTAKELQAHELVLGASNKYTVDDQMDQLALYWIDLHGGQPAPLTVRILSRDRDIHLDIAGGSRIPKISERQARSVADLRAAGVGVSRVLLLHDGTPESSDLFTTVLTALDPDVGLAIVPMIPAGTELLNGLGLIKHDQERAGQLDRELQIFEVTGNEGAEIVRIVEALNYGLIVVPLPQVSLAAALSNLDPRIRYVVDHAPCRVILAAPQMIPQEIMDKTES